jgi:transcriptional regulator with XRE-family HTH domain
MKLKDYLEKSGRTQSEFADAVGTTQGRISQLINVVGDMPSLDLARRIRSESDGAVDFDDWQQPKQQRRKAA